MRSHEQPQDEPGNAKQDVERRHAAEMVIHTPRPRPYAVNDPGGKNKKYDS